MRSLVELQSFKDSKLALFTIVILGLLPLVLFGIGWSKMKHFDTENIWGIALTISITLFTMLILLRMKTFIQLQPNKLIYQNRPFFGKKKPLSIDQIQHWEINNHRWLDGLGYRSTLQGTRVFVMKPGKVLVIKTNDGRTYKFGINRPAMVKRFIQTNWEQNEKSYG